MKTSTITVPHPEVASREEWQARREELLAKEKEVTRHRDRVVAERRRLPMVQLDKKYEFQGSHGKQSLGDLFDGRRQLIVYHFMFHPKWDEGCPGCTGFVNALGDLSMLGQRDTTMALISRAPLAKLEAYKARKGWTLPWVSSFESDFNQDFKATVDDGERPGLSVFFRVVDDLFQTYSTQHRGVENVTDSYSLLDLTPYGRQEDWEDSPPGWPQKPTYGG